MSDLLRLQPLTTINVGVGTPPTTYQLIVDTGSSNTFVGANTKYTPTSSSRDTGNQVAVSYGGGGSFKGEECEYSPHMSDSLMASISVIPLCLSKSYYYSFSPSLAYE